MKKSIFRPVGHVLLTIVLIALLLLNLSPLWGIDKYVVTSGSMEPSIPTGSIAVVNSNVKFEDVSIGDVIIFEYEQSRIIHRVVDEKVMNGERYLKTKGDANKRDDGFLTTKDNYYGVSVVHIPELGKIILSGRR